MNKAFKSNCKTVSLMSKFVREYAIGPGTHIASKGRVNTQYPTEWINVLAYSVAVDDFNANN